MGDASAISQVANIIESYIERGSGIPAVTVSATSGTTDRLIALGEAALCDRDGDCGDDCDWEKILDSLIEKHTTIIRKLEIDLDLEPYRDELQKIVRGVRLLKELSLRTKDKIMAFGERISSNILAALLRKRRVSAEALDAYNFFFADNNFGDGNVDIARTEERIRENVGGVIKKGIIPIITGFIAQSKSGQYITLGRGGSDYTAAIVAAALCVSELQIWTDVDGIFNTDPRLIKEAQVLERLSFNEAGELAYFGAKVLHPKTIKPAIEKNIPVKILNTFNPDAPGTLITNEEEESVKSVTYKKGITIINVCSAGMLEARGFLARLFEVFAKHQIPVDVVSTSEVSVSLTVENGAAEKVRAELEEFSTVTLFEKMAIVCLVGGGIRAGKGILGKLFSAVSDYYINMVSVGASKRNVTFLVKEEEAPEIVRAVFNTFFNRTEA